jgi:hypothetical protein
VILLTANPNARTKQEALRLPVALIYNINLDINLDFLDKR